MRSTEQRGVWALTYGDELAIWSDEEGCILPVWSDEQQPGVGLKVFPGHEVTSYSIIKFAAEVRPQTDRNELASHSSTCMLVSLCTGSLSLSGSVAHSRYSQKITV